MISRLRRDIAVGAALVVTVLTLGRVRVNWTGRSAAEDGSDDPGRPAVTRTHQPPARQPGAPGEPDGRP
jgi:hypothetical protein